MAARHVRTAREVLAFDEEHDRMGPERWRSAQPLVPRVKACPNECRGRGRCSYGFCHCESGRWGLDCGFSAADATGEGGGGAPLVYVYEVDVVLRRSCGPWGLPEELGDRLLRSAHVTADPSRATLYWIYGCPEGGTVLAALAWVRRSFEYWNASVAAGTPRHVLAFGHEEGWAEVWFQLRSWMREDGRHVDWQRTWAEVHPASPTRQLVALQLTGHSDFTVGGVARRRGVSIGAPCRICFQPGKDVVLPGFPGIQDYPNDLGREIGAHRGSSLSVCERLAQLRPFADDGVSLSPRPRTPRLFFSGAAQTKTHGPGLYEPSRLVLYACWKNRSSRHGFLIRQTESVGASVYPWEVEAPVDALALTRNASLCAVPEGKLGSYGHRSIVALLLGCVPLYTKELSSHHFFDEVIDWSTLSVHVPPHEMPQLPQKIAEADVEALRLNAARMRRRLLWTSIYGPCHLHDGEGGDADAFETLMQVLAIPRVHFSLQEEHSAPRAPELLDELYPWLRKRGGEDCTHGYQCFDRQRRVSCA